MTGMKRAEALQPLSRDQHQALFLGFWLEHGRRHLPVEEEVLLPVRARGGDRSHRALRGAPLARS
jgi:hypothetical protein